MTLKRKPVGDEKANYKSSPENSGLDNVSEGLGSFSSYLGDAASEKPPLELDAFAPYKPTETASTPQPSKRVQPDSAIAAQQTPTQTKFAASRSTDEVTDFSSLLDDSFGAGLQGLHAAPSVPPDYVFDDNKADEPHIADEISDAGSAFSTAFAEPIRNDFATSVNDYSTFDTALSGGAESTSPTESARLFVRFGKFSATYDIDRPSLMIGRTDPAAPTTPEILLDWDDAVSRKHALISHKGEDDYIQDVGSTNGTKLNGVPLLPNTPELLMNGDLIHIGTEIEIAYYK